MVVRLAVKIVKLNHMLVPGTIGYHGATALFLDGGANLTDTTLLALRLLISLVGGLLFGNTLLPPRRGH